MNYFPRGYWAYKSGKSYSEFSKECQKLGLVGGFYKTKEELLEELRILMRELGKAPTAKECDSCKYTSNSSTYIRKFGSWKKALESIGYDYSEFILSQLIRLEKELGKSPTAKECNSCKYTANASTYEDYFGSWNNALKKAGLEVNNHIYKEEELISRLQDYYNKTGNIPVATDFNYKVYIRIFGSWNNALEKAGLKKNHDTVDYEDLKISLLALSEKLGRNPTRLDVVSDKDLTYGASTYHRAFGSFNNALKEAGLEINNISSTAEYDIKSFLEEYGINVEQNNREILKGKEIDLYLPDYKIGIEYDGLYWHSHEIKQDKNYHLNKTLGALKEIRLIHIFENEWIYRPDIVKSRLLHILRLKEKIYARKCRIAELQDTSFFDKYHLQGSVPSSINLGLYYKDELVAAMSFSKTRFSKQYEYELLRFASKYSVVGGASKLFKYFILNYNPSSVISYCDFRWGTGELYEKLGFKFSHRSTPNYWYFKYDYLESRVKYQKHKLSSIFDNFDSSLTEYENMLNNGYNKIYDCGNLVYVWQNSM